MAGLFSLRLVNTDLSCFVQPQFRTVKVLLNVCSLIPILINYVIIPLSADVSWISLSSEQGILAFHYTAGDLFPAVQRFIKSVSIY